MFVRSPDLTWSFHSIISGETPRIQCGADSIATGGGDNYYGAIVVTFIVVILAVIIGWQVFKRKEL